MISNPCKWASTDGRYIEFTHEGGNKIFHFSPDEKIDKVFDHWIPLNLIFFANDKEHAANIIERMLKFRMLASEKHKKRNGGDDRNNLMLSVIPILLSKKDKWIITEAPTDQFYQVGWASNDTIL